jgi:hypothetical protein
MVSDRMRALLELEQKLIELSKRSGAVQAELNELYKLIDESALLLSNMLFDEYVALVK